MAAVVMKMAAAAMTSSSGAVAPVDGTLAMALLADDPIRIGRGATDALNGALRQSAEAKVRSLGACGRVGVSENGMYRFKIEHFCSRSAPDTGASSGRRADSRREPARSGDHPVSLLVRPV